MNLHFTGLVLFFSLVMGSFANNLISFFIGTSKFDLKRSRCSCGKRNLTLSELLPLLSFTYQMGRCRECKSKLSRRYVMTEILSGVLGLVTYYRYGLSGMFLINYLIFFCLLIIGIVDYLVFIIPDYMVLAILVLSAVKLLFSGQINLIWLNIMLSFSIVIFFSLINRFILKKKGKEAMGCGDIKLLSALMFLPDPVLSLIAVWFSAFIAIPGSYILKAVIPGFRTTPKIPFGFFLSLGFLICTFFDIEVLSLYYMLLGV